MTEKKHWVLAIWIIIVVVGAIAFVFKMTEFAYTLMEKGNRFGWFGAIAIGGYFLGMLPILLLTLWGICKGYFRDIERPKYRMLEMQKEIDAYGNRVPTETTKRRDGPTEDREQKLHNPA
jgi:hypothetical protein